MLCMFEGTGLLEQNLSSFRAMHKDQRQNTSRSTLRSLLKILVDCDGAVSYSPKSKEYTLTEFGMRAYNRYRSLYGAAKNTATTALPRRTVRPRCSSTGLAAFKRQQSKEKAEVIAADLPEAEACSLKRVLDTAAEQQQTKRQKSLVQSLAQRVTEKLALVSPAAFSKDAASRLERLQKEDRERLAKLDAVQLRELKNAETMDAQGGLCVCIISKGEISRADQIIKDRARTLHKLCGMRVCHLTSTNLVARCLEAKYVIFLATSREAEAGLIYHGSESHESLDVGTCVSRLIGGFIAGPSWLDECVHRGHLLMPLLRLSPAVKIERQVGFDDSLPQQSAVLRLLAAIESHRLGHRVWVIRSKRAEMPLARVLV